MRMPPDFDWDHVHVFLTVIRAASLRQAAEELGVTHPTIRRRLDTLEEVWDLRLFDRRPDGLHATPEALELQPIAEEIEERIYALARRATAADPKLRGPVRVSMPQVLASDLLMPDIVSFQERWPEIELTVDVDYALADLAAREADVAVRTVVRDSSPDENLVGRNVTQACHAVYGTADGWIGWSAEGLDEWVAASPFPTLPVRAVIPDPVAHRAACAAGLGRAMLPCFFAEPMLERVTEPEPRWDIWVLVHPDLRKSPRLRLFRDHIVDSIGRHEPRLAPSGPSVPGA